MIRTTFFKPYVDRVIALSRGQTGRDFLLTAGANFVIAVLGAVGGILAARLLGPEGRGELAAAVVWAAVLGVVVSFGLPQALTYYAAREPAAAGSIFYAALGMLIGQSVLVIIGGWTIVTVTLTTAQPAAVASVRLYLLTIPASTLITYLSTISQGLRRFQLFSSLRIAASATYIGGLIIAGVAGWSEAYQIIPVLVILQWLVSGMGLVVFVRRVRPQGYFETWRARQLLKYGLKTYWGSLSWMANARLDQFIMSAFVSLSELGEYAVAVSYATVLFPLSGAFAMVLFQRVAASEHIQAIPKIKRALRLNLFVSMGGAVVLGLAVPVLLPWLFGAEYQPAVFPALILLAGTVLLGINYVLSDGLRGLGAPFITSIAEMGGFVVTVGGLLILLPRLGIYGAALASVASYGLVTAVLILGLIHVARKQRWKHES